MNLDNFKLEMLEMKLKLYRMRKARREYFLQQVPYRAWFWLLILFSLYLVSPF